MFDIVKESNKFLREQDRYLEQCGISHDPDTVEGYFYQLLVQAVEEIKRLRKEIKK